MLTSRNLGWAPYSHILTSSDLSRHGEVSLTWALMDAVSSVEKISVWVFVEIGWPNLLVSSQRRFDWWKDEADLGIMLPLTYRPSALLLRLRNTPILVMWSTEDIALYINVWRWGSRPDPSSLWGQNNRKVAMMLNHSIVACYINKQGLYIPHFYWHSLCLSQINSKEEECPSRQVRLQESSSQDSFPSFLSVSLQSWNPWLRKEVPSTSVRQSKHFAIFPVALIWKCLIESYVFRPQDELGSTNMATTGCS